MVDSEQTPKFNPAAFRLSTLFLVMTLIGVAMGLIVGIPAVGWPLAVISTPVFVRSVRIVQHRQSLGVTVTSLEKVRVFLRTLAVVTALVAIWCVSGVTCLVGFCGTASSISYRGGNETIVLFGLLVLGSLGVWLSMWLNKKYETKYQEEIGADGEREAFRRFAAAGIEQEETEDAEL